MVAHLAVYGCQQNQADGDRLRGFLLEMGYALTDDRGEADLVVLVTCAVRKHAETKLLGHLGTYLHGGKPGRKVVLCGCMAQREEIRELLRKRYKQVSLSFGPADLGRFPIYLRRLEAEGGRHIITSPDTAPIEEGLPVARVIDPELNRANVTIMTGCDNFCSYCVVPYVRGRERSRAPEAVLAEVRGLVEETETPEYDTQNRTFTADRTREIWLLGQNVNSYKPDFPDLLRACGSLDGDFSIRFMTSHPRDAGTRLFEVMARTPHIAPFLHLPVQSGSGAVLKAMNRGYTRTEYLEKIRAAKAVIPGLTLTSDVMVGFPGETEQDFMDTLSLLEEVRFAKLFTFQYSPRAGTPAGEWPQTVSQGEMKERFLRLLEVQKRIEEESGG
ncbi:MAG: MiaB/RimO family radical SAM methylthiotransferase [Oscillospiraceae bacterium]|jgi:tRNA-2-methylthio-N6-dimethylallyladenosine synthase|nr:MiaB/RimO family radical SAM methylthiotransferase [Oscillospiraceae bacterium]